MLTDQENLWSSISSTKLKVLYCELSEIKVYSDRRLTIEQQKKFNHIFQILHAYLY